LLRRAGRVGGGVLGTAARREDGRRGAGDRSQKITGYKPKYGYNCICKADKEGLLKNLAEKPTKMLHKCNIYDIS
jgi:hypothetical protein